MTYWGAVSKYTSYFVTGFITGMEKKNETPSGKFSTPYSKFCMDKICAAMESPNPEPL